MTNKEAIRWFEITIQICHSQGDALEAMKMAIEALEEKEAREQYEKWEAIEEEEAREYFERKRPLCEDCISRQALLARSKLKRGLALTQKESGDLWKYIYLLEKQQPCEDCISREALLAKIDEERKHLLDLKMDGAEHIVVHHARQIIEEMPPVTPQPKIGHWEVTYIDGDIYHLRCSACKEEDNRMYPVDKYCPNCGVKMEVEE